jgi:hypothetical protein
MNAILFFICLLLLVTYIRSLDTRDKLKRALGEAKEQVHGLQSEIQRLEVVETESPALPAPCDDRPFCDCKPYEFCAMCKPSLCPQ